MKNANTMLKQIQTLLGVQEEVQEVQLAQMTLENGTIIEADEFKAENEVFIVTEDERIALPVGDYLLEDGNTLVVAEEGIIAEIKEVGNEEEVEEPTEELAEEKEEEKEEMNYATKEELSSAMDELKEMIEEVKAMMNPKEEEAELNAELKEELSAPASEPIKHSPENSAEKKSIGYNFGAKRTGTVQDRVNQVLNQFKK